MIVVGLKNQMGNQMFQYAAVKTIAQEKSLDFKCYFVPTAHKYINSIDEKHGTFVGTLFNIDRHEIIDKIPEGMSLYLETDYRKKYDFRKSFYEEAYDIHDNTLIDGHFESLRYFKNNRNNVKKWFCFHIDVKEKCDRIINKIRVDNPKRPLISVHFRAGKDFTVHGYTLEKKYWIKAAYKAQEYFNNPLFLCFFDKENTALKLFNSKFESINIHGSLVEDMYIIRMCDGHIICNSTYSVMSAFIGRNSSKTYCPSVYPVSLSYKNCEDYFLEEWEMVQAKRSLPASIYNVLQWVNIKVYKRICCKKNY